mmetsp:Transcript_1094/g.3661  ORF Transcript_1094/g.3661 Transcript_1094/m.3661 type:complete len:240 (-) Transcript_1094:134-853(-)
MQPRAAAQQARPSLPFWLWPGPPTPSLPAGGRRRGGPRCAATAAVRTGCLRPAAQRRGTAAATRLTSSACPPVRRQPPPSASSWQPLQRQQRRHARRVRRQWRTRCRSWRRTAPSWARTPSRRPMEGGKGKAWNPRRRRRSLPKSARGGGRRLQGKCRTRCGTSAAKSSSSPSAPDAIQQGRTRSKYPRASSGTTWSAMATATSAKSRRLFAMARAKCLATLKTAPPCRIIRNAALSRP